MLEIYLTDVTIYNMSTRKLDSKKTSIHVLRGSIKKINKSIELSNLRSHHIFDYQVIYEITSINMLIHFTIQRPMQHESLFGFLEFISYNKCKANEKL